MGIHNLDVESQNCDNSELLAMAKAFQIDQARLHEERRNRENNDGDDVERRPERNPIFGTGSGSVTENNSGRGAGAGASGRGAGRGAPGRGAGAGALGRGRGEGMRGRGEGFRVRGDGARGRGEANRGRQDAPQEPHVHRILVADRASRGLFMCFRGRGDVGRGRGDVSRGRGEVVRGRGEVVRGRAESRGRGGSPRRGSPRGRGIEIPMPRMDPAIEQRINSIMGEFSLLYIADPIIRPPDSEHS